jgi:Fe-S-cluster containining protein
MSECERCGTCCRKGGPALHREDLALFERGVIERSDCVTLRAGELVHNPVRDVVEPLAQEVVRFRSWSGTRACRFFMESGASCRIYKRRPVECVALFCKEPDKLIDMYMTDRITRADIIPENSAMADIMAEHEERAAVRRLGALAERIGQGDDSALDEATAMVHYDVALRGELTRRVGCPPEHVLVFFGRPLPEVVRGFGLRWLSGEGRLARMDSTQKAR